MLRGFGNVRLLTEAAGAVAATATAAWRPRSLPARGAARQHAVEGPLDRANGGILAGKFGIVLVNQHRGVDLEHEQIAAIVDRTIDAETIEPAARANRAQRVAMAGMNAGTANPAGFGALRPEICRLRGRKTAVKW
jgi:hypothetical protein